MPLFLRGLGYLESCPPYLGSGIGLVRDYGIEGSVCSAASMVLVQSFVSRFFWSRFGFRFLVKGFVFREWCFQSFEFRLWPGLGFNASRVHGLEAGALRGVTPL